MRLEDTGSIPPLTRTQDPTAYKGYEPVQMPMPEPQNTHYEPNSLWRTGASTFFKDQRASRVGDIVTVLVTVDDEAQANNSSDASRDSKLNAAIEHLFNVNKKWGIENKLGASSKPEMKASTKTARNEKVKCSLAATVIQILPNGNLVISARQEMRINFEVRTVFLTGVIRPEDISSTNTIPLVKIAEARFSYGGYGDQSDFVKVPVAQQLFTQFSPL
jgi:flagellar L-ring protein precursor FlgH